VRITDDRPTLVGTITPFARRRPTVPCPDRFLPAPTDGSRRPPAYPFFENHYAYSSERTRVGNIVPPSNTYGYRPTREHRLRSARLRPIVFPFHTRRTLSKRFALPTPSQRPRSRRAILGTHPLRLVGIRSLYTFRSFGPSSSTVNRNSHRLNFILVARVVRTVSVGLFSPVVSTIHSWTLLPVVTNSFPYPPTIVKPLTFVLAFSCVRLHCCPRVY